jgi:pimeloyl-ACP methyl ester carboxylesterase
MRIGLRSSASSRLEILECRPNGESARPPLLFIHGAFAGAWTFAEHFLPYFAARGFPAYALSLRGHGASYGRDSLALHSLRDYVDDLAEAIDAIGEAPVLVGHSMGAMVVMKYLERAEPRAAALLAPIPPQGLWPATLTLALSKPCMFIEMNGLISWGRVSPDAMHRALFAGPMSRERAVAYYRRFQRESTRAIWDMMFFDLPSPWRMHRPPTLVLLADRDRLFPLEQSRAAFAAFGLGAEVLNRVGHAVVLDAGWQQAADRVLAWLDGISRKL